MKEKLELVWKYCKRILLYFFISTITVTVLYRFVNPPITFLMVQRVFEKWFDGEGANLSKDWKTLDEISKSLPLAVVASEDQLFLTHWGFDFNSISKAYSNNQGKKNKSIKGASTITQQVAKNVFLWPQRSWVRKGFEVYFTVLIEILWDKERIMEVYLNVIEMGDGVYGVEAAGKKYFNRPAKKISRNQAALLAAVLPNPRKYSAKKPSAYILKRQQWILRNMTNLGEVKFENYEMD